MFYYLVAYDFEAADESELTVSKGELVTSNQQLVEDEWILVTTVSSPQREGYVPGSFMVESSPPRSNPSSVPQNPSSTPILYSSTSPLATFASTSFKEVPNTESNSLYTTATQFEHLIHRFEKTHAQLTSQIRILDHLCSDCL
ncbi:hypothetical protein P9112_011412 [Eukaryota sp. TZLM1-RC]